VEGAVSDTQICPQIVTMRVLPIALKKRESCYPVSLFKVEEGIGNLLLTLLFLCDLLSKRLLLSLDG
jgi:hypothetical protein